MKDPRTRLLLMLASLDSSPGEIHRLLRWLQEIGPDRATNMIESVRRSVGDFQNFAVAAPKQMSTIRNARVDRSTLERLENFLLSETGLTKREAVKLVTREIQATVGTTQGLPKYEKISLGIWLERVSNRVGANTMLQIASRIRNDLVNKQSIDWPLRRE